MAPHRANRALTVPPQRLQVKQKSDKDGALRAKSVGASAHLVELNSRIQHLLSTVTEIQTGRIAVLGKAKTGKSSLVRLLAFGQFTEDYTSTTSEATIPAFALLRLRAPTGFARPALGTRISRQLTVKISKGAAAHLDVDPRKTFTSSDFDAVIASGSEKLGATGFIENPAEKVVFMRSLKMAVTDTVTDFKTCSPLNYKACIGNCYAFILVVSTDDPSSIKAAREVHADIVRGQGNLKKPAILVVNKCDIPDVERKVDWAAIQDLAKSLNIPRVDVSCKNKYGIDEILVQIAALSSQFNSKRAELLEEEVPDDYVFLPENERKKKSMLGQCVIS